MTVGPALRWSNRIPTWVRIVLFMTVVEPPPPASDSVGTWTGFRDDLRTAHPRLLLSLGEGYPVVAKQLIQGFFMLVWPFWAVTAVVYAVVWNFVVFPVMWVLFWPVRVIFKDKTPTESGKSTL